MSTTRANQLLGLWETHQALGRSLKGAPKRHLESPLSLWANNSDRGIPVDLVRKNVSELLELSFDELIDAPGVGVTKLTKLMELLGRVRNGEPHAVGEWSPATTRWNPAAAPRAADSPAAQWSADVQTLRQSGLESLPLGRLAESLLELPRTLWRAPLGQFTSLSFDALQALPYFGARRVRTLVRIVGDAARLARAAGSNAMTWQTRSIQAAEAWIKGQFSQPSTDAAPSVGDVRSGLVEFLSTQLEIDLGRPILAVLEHLVAQASAAAGRRRKVAAGVAALSRPRLHQMKEDIRHVLEIRWPEGAGLMEALAKSVARRPGGEGCGRFLLAVVESVFVQHAPAGVRLAEIRTNAASATPGAAAGG
jgi:hypothetical protein